MSMKHKQALISMDQKPLKNANWKSSGHPSSTDLHSMAQTGSNASDIEQLFAETKGQEAVTLQSDIRSSVHRNCLTSHWNESLEPLLKTSHCVQL